MWIAPASIVYGTPLSGTQLDASANNVGGTFAYTPAAGSIPGVGNQPLSVMFTPTDTVDYNAVNTGTTLSVTPATLTITASDATKTQGDTQSFSSKAFTVSGLVTANGDSVTSVTETSDGAPASAGPGNYDILPSAAMGMGLSNYNIDYVKGSLTVNALPPPPPATPPSFQGEHRMVVSIKKKKVTDFVLTFSDTLSTPGGVYQVTQPGKGKKPPTHVPVTSTTLGPGGKSVILTLGKYTTGKPLSLMASGLTGTNGAAVKSFTTAL
jgi:hypothetical protein